MPTYMKLEDLHKLPDAQFYNNPPMPGDCYEKTILYPIEVARRQRLHQHELNVKLIEKQKTTTIIAAIIGVVAALAGASLGAYLNNRFQAEPAIQKLQQLEKQIQKGEVVQYAAPEIRNPYEGVSSRPFRFTGGLLTANDRSCPMISPLQ